MGTCAWALWHNRNEVRLGGVRKSGTVLLQWALQYLEEFYAASDLPSTSSGLVVQGQTWSPLMGHSYKVYEARVRFGTRVRVRVRDSIIFEKGGCGCGRTRRLKNY